MSIVICTPYHRRLVCRSSEVARCSYPFYLAFVGSLVGGQRNYYIPVRHHHHNRHLECTYFGVSVFSVLHDDTTILGIYSSSTYVPWQINAANRLFSIDRNAGVSITRCAQNVPNDIASDRHKFYCKMACENKLGMCVDWVWYMWISQGLSLSIGGWWNAWKWNNHVGHLPFLVFNVQVILFLGKSIYI